MNTLQNKKSVLNVDKKVINTNPKLIQFNPKSLHFRLIKFQAKQVLFLVLLANIQGYLDRNNWKNYIGFCRRKSFQEPKNRQIDLECETPQRIRISGDPLKISALINSIQFRCKIHYETTNTSHLKEFHNHDINIPQLIIRFQEKEVQYEIDHKSNNPTNRKCQITKRTTKMQTCKMSQQLIIKKFYEKQEKKKIMINIYRSQRTAPSIYLQLFHYRLDFVQVNQRIPI